jgi:succinate dehydrogenase/fumarate reductase-like Fe-S protein
VEVDGKNKLACTTLAKDGMKIGPAAKRKVIRDLFIEEAPR